MNALAVRLMSGLFVACFFFTAEIGSAGATVVTVLGTDDIFAAGLASSPPASGNGGPLPGGTLPKSITVFGGEVLNISATGLIGCCTSPLNVNGPDGRGTSSNITNSSSSAVGNYNDSTGAFALAGFYAGAADNNVFKIGSGGTFIVPSGATLLYLGIPDAFSFNGPSGWYDDNLGSLTVTIDAVSAVPEPSTWAMLILGFTALGFMTRRKKVIAKAT